EKLQFLYFSREFAAQDASGLGDLGARTVESAGAVPAPDLELFAHLLQQRTAEWRFASRFLERILAHSRDHLVVVTHMHGAADDTPEPERAQNFDDRAESGV